METRSKRRKRQRLMTISSNVSRQRPDVPARFESLNDDTLHLILQFVGKKSYRSFGGVNKHCKEIYLTTEGMTKETYMYGYAPLAVIKEKIERPGPGSNLTLHKAVGKGVVLYNRSDVLAWAFQQRNKKILEGICHVAAAEGRIDLLDEVWNNVHDEYNKRYLRIDDYAASHGKLEVLKWLEDKGVTIIKSGCAYLAACHGQLNILQWLQEEKGFELKCSYYINAIEGNHLHVMKWLREQEVPWDLDNFKYATEKGNLNILQWLHDEGCPWPEYLGVYLYELEPEVVDWLRVNGYSSRLYRD